MRPVVGEPRHMVKDAEVVEAVRIEDRIHLVRGHSVILDRDLAELYGVTTSRLNEQVKRNAERFPEDFAFQLSREEYKALRSQIATIKRGRGQHPKYLPHVFTEHGAIMAANVLRSPRAIEASVLVVRAFVRMRQFFAAHRELGDRVNTLEEMVKGHGQAIVTVVNAIKQLMDPPEQPKPGIGFKGEAQPGAKPGAKRARKKPKARRKRS